ncbi:hypothetical protein SISSUDRAFT_1037320 [Sistotremastrum suecicum HHB10207 ss-3]|uniref:Uncharacterized protein n=1 Tax=Sistotremastrum suecicum HHB10207 ss-3 TaxID=1314776 RepID=A0A165YB19_9AGAM|nr:hypothetical protein SISSUDRAFT_1037320 [Sistotremastrum suecicum HHB10207 ss-3]
MSSPLTANRPIVLHHSALSTVEFSTFMPELYDIYGLALPEPHRIFGSIDTDFIHKNKILNHNELRGWLKGRLRQELRSSDLQTVFDIVEASAELEDGIVSGQVLAIFRLISHCLSPNTTMIEKNLVWVPSPRTFLFLPPLEFLARAFHPLTFRTLVPPSPVGTIMSFPAAPSVLPWDQRGILAGRLGLSFRALPVWAL